MSFKNVIISLNQSYSHSNFNTIYVQIVVKCHNTKKEKNKILPKSPAVIPAWPPYDMGLTENKGQHGIVKKDH